MKKAKSFFNLCILHEQLRYCRKFVSEQIFKTDLEAKCFFVRDFLNLGPTESTSAQQWFNSCPLMILERAQATLNEETILS